MEASPLELDPVRRYFIIVIGLEVIYRALLYGLRCYQENMSVKSLLPQTPLLYRKNWCLPGITKFSYY